MNVFELEASLSLNTNEYERALADAQTRAEQFEDAVEDVGTAAKRAEPDVEGLGDEVKKTSDEFDKGAEPAEDWGEKVEGAALQANLLASAIETGIDFVSDFASAVWNLDEATEDFRIAQAKVNTAFETSGYSAEDAQAAYRELYAVLGDTDQAAEASQLLAKLATGTEDFTAWGTIAAGVAGTFGDALPIESLIESANETAKVGQVTGTLADALNWAGISEDEFNARLAELNTTEERTALITETLNGEYSEAAGIFLENSGAIMANREAHFRLTEAQAGAGEEMSRLKTALTTMFTPAAEAVFDVVERWAGALATAVERHNELRQEFTNPLPTGSIEEAEAALAEMRTRYDELTALAPETFTGEAAVEYAALGNQIKFAEEQLQEMYTAAENSEGFSTSGAGNMESYIAGMNSMSGAAVATAQNIGAATAAALQSSMSFSTGGYKSSGKSYGKASYRAGGLDYVPYDGYPIIAHKGEKLLTRAEAEDYDGGNREVLSAILSALNAGREINLMAPDGKVIAKYIAPYMGQQMALVR